MSQPRYDLYFKGDLIDGFFVDFVKSDLQERFKTDEAYVDRLFSGSELSIKKGVDKATAVKYQQAFKAAGAKLIVRPQASAAPQPASTVTKNASSNQQPSNTAKLTTTMTAVAGENATDLNERHQPTIKAPNAVPDWSVAEPGAQLTTPREMPKVDVNVSAFTLADPGEDLLAEKTLEAAPPIVDLDGIALAELGATIEVLKEAKPDLKIDTSHIHLE